MQNSGEEVLSTGSIGSGWKSKVTVWSKVWVGEPNFSYHRVREDEKVAWYPETGEGYETDSWRLLIDLHMS